MSKKKFFVPFAAFSLLLASLVACGGGNNNQPSSGGKVDESSAPADKSSSDVAPSSDAASSSSVAPVVHTHDYKDAATTVVKNADDKNVSLFECKENDNGKLMTIAFDDYSEKSADFNDSKLSGYTSVPEALRNSSHVLAKDSVVTWKVNVDKAITGAKLAFGVVYTGDDHNTQTGSDGGTVKYSLKANDGNFVDWAMGTNTYAGVGLSQTVRNYYVFGSIDLVAGENTISVRQNNAGYRLLFGGDVRIIYEGDAVPVNAPATGYNITFVPAEHCKVEVFIGETETVETNKTQSVNADALDEDGHYIPAKYVAPVDDDPATDVDESVAEVKPEVIFKLVFDDGYIADGNDITISGTMGKEWNKLCSDDEDNSYNITKIKANITVTIAVRAVTGEEPEGYVGTFSIQHGTIVVYKGEKKNGEDTPDVNGKYLSRVKKGGVSKTKAQFNFEVIPETGYEFVINQSEADLADGVSPIGVIDFVTGNFGNFKRVTAGENLFSITKVASDITINIVCTPVA